MVVCQLLPAGANLPESSTRLIRTLVTRRSDSGDKIAFILRTLVTHVLIRNPKILQIAYVTKVRIDVAGLWTDAKPNDSD
jgi:hypothetical protein